MDSINLMKGIRNLCAASVFDVGEDFLESGVSGSSFGSLIYKSNVLLLLERLNISRSSYEKYL